MLCTIYVCIIPVILYPLIVELRCNIHSYMLYTIDVSYILVNYDVTYIVTCYTREMCLKILVILYPLIVELSCNIHSYMLYRMDVSYNTCNTIPSYCRIMM